MEWQATDQFGNLYVATSDATGVEELAPHLESLVDELRSRVGTAFTVSVDAPYGEISGPDPGRVSHMLKVDWLTSASESDLEEIQTLIQNICADRGVHLESPR
jgi:hypothetical protein